MGEVFWSTEEGHRLYLRKLKPALKLDGFSSFKINFYWSTATLQCCICFYCSAKWINYLYTHTSPFGLLPYLGHQSTLSSAPLLFSRFSYLFFVVCFLFIYLFIYISWIYTCSPSWTPLPPPSSSHPSGSSQCTNPEHLFHASNLGWQSVSHLIIYFFQCYSLRLSHPHLLP